MNMLYKHLRSSLVQSRGFTLIELMVTLAIVGILMTAAIPSFQSIIQGNRIQSAAAELQNGLAMARAEAIKRGGDARVTLLANSVTAGVANWNGGFTVFYDTTGTANSLDASTVTQGNKLMQTAPTNSLINITSNGPGYVTYNGLGRSILTTGANLEASFTIRAATGAAEPHVRCIILSSSGRTRSARFTPSDFAALSPASTCPTR